MVKQRFSKKQMIDNFMFEKKGWTGKSGNSCGPRYVLDTVVHHEQDTSCKYRIKRLLELAEGLTLETGCNVCGIGMYLSQKNGVKMVELDFMMPALNKANRKMKLLQKGEYSEGWKAPFCHPPNFKPDCMFVCSDMNHVPFRPEVFDTVVMSESIEHLPKPHRLKAVKDMVRILKLGGRLVITTPMLFEDPDRPDWMEDVMTKVHPYGLATEKDLLGYAEKLGLELISFETSTHDKVTIAFLVAKKNV